MRKITPFPWFDNNAEVQMDKIDIQRLKQAAGQK